RGPTGLRVGLPGDDHGRLHARHPDQPDRAGALMAFTRITQNMMTRSSLASLQANLARTAKLQEQMSTGRVINRPSDSPTGTSTAMRLRGDLAANGQYQRNAQDGVSWLGTIDNTL